jgi:hypothetical protein
MWSHHARPSVITITNDNTIQKDFYMDGFNNNINHDHL